MPAESTVRDRDDPGYQLIETLRWQRDTGFLRGERHLARMRNSAELLGFQWQREAVETSLADAVAGAKTDTLRLRLTLDRDGKTGCTSAVFQPLAPDKVWRIQIARTKLDSHDTLLRHKTTRRAVYEAARAEYPLDTTDEVLLLNERAELCDGTITTVFLDIGDGGPMLTPALDCGLLEGVLRAAMLEEGTAREAIVTLSELSTARSVYVGNSLRGLIPARLI